MEQPGFHSLEDMSSLADVYSFAYGALSHTVDLWMDATISTKDFVDMVDSLQQAVASACERIIESRMGGGLEVAIYAPETSQDTIPGTTDDDSPIYRKLVQLSWPTGPVTES